MRVIFGLIIIATFIITIHNNQKLNNMDQKFLDVLKRIDDATNTLASEIRDLKDKITNVGLPSDQTAELLADLEGVATKLEGIGAPDAPTGTVS